MLKQLKFLSILIASIVISTVLFLGYSLDVQQLISQNKSLAESVVIDQQPELANKIGEVIVAARPFGNRQKAVADLSLFRNH